ncbi:YifB family Mg chelatase-like AAA ATPase [bacterium]|nr:YifB family Mg chelatase-like AAA ATPase [bacterium]
MVVKINTACTVGLDACDVAVEIDVVNAAQSCVVIVGLPDIAVKEAESRVKSAIKNSGYTFPSKRVVVNLAPADLKKNGTHFDLPVAVGILAEEEVLESEKLQNYAFLGELSLDGEINAVRGVLPLVMGLKESGIKNIIVPENNVKEAALVDGINVYGANSLNEVVHHFIDEPLKPTSINLDEYLNNALADDFQYDFKDVKGQQKAKKAMEIAAAGAHNILMVGSPGAGKTMMARCFKSILPPLTKEEALELTKIYSIAGLLMGKEHLIVNRPFRAVHHTASANGIIGGGTTPKPGEITLAHRGVLFLDEMVEFPRPVLEVLRQPLEDGYIVISRAKNSITYPAKFILLGAMNPCPCGYLGDKEKQCTCAEFQINRYLSRISGPLLDRIDLQVDVTRLTSDELLNMKPADETSKDIRERVIKARKIQAERYKNDGILTNSELNTKLLRKYCKLSEDCEKIFKTAIVKYGLSGRKYDRILKLSRTIADLEGSADIKPPHIMQALQYRISEVTEMANK